MTKQEAVKYFFTGVMMISTVLALVTHSRLMRAKAQGSLLSSKHVLDALQNKYFYISIGFTLVAAAFGLLASNVDAVF